MIEIAIYGGTATDSLVSRFKAVRKLPIIVLACEMEEPFKVYTLEGVMEGKTGDFLMLGVNGEYYPCAREIFLKTYEFCVPEKDEKMENKVEIDRLRSDNAKLCKVVIDALTDDYYNDHSSGCWQQEAQKILGVDYEEDDECAIEKLQQKLKEVEKLEI